MSNSSTNKDIISGKGLKPLTSTQQAQKQTGIITEQRAEKGSGIRMDKFTKN